jgi:hypothetical protein
MACIEAIGVRRYLGPLEHAEQFRFAAQQP